jgi:hypothetical protein
MTVFFYISSFHQILTSQWIEYTKQLPVSYKSLAKDFLWKYPALAETEVRSSSICLAQGLIENVCALGLRSLLRQISKLPAFDTNSVFEKLCENSPTSYIRNYLSVEYILSTDLPSSL